MERVCESVGMITCQWCCSVCSILTQDDKLNRACLFGRLEEARSIVERGGDPNWKDMVSLQLVHSHCVFRDVVYCTRSATITNLL